MKRIQRGDAFAKEKLQPSPTTDIYPFIPSARGYGRSTRLPTPETAFTAAQKSELETIVAKAVPTRPPRPLGVPLNYNFNQSHCILVGMI